MNYNFDEKKLFGLFVADNDVYRPILNNPYRRDGYVYASDGQKLIRVKDGIVSGYYEMTNGMTLNIPTDNCDYTITDMDIEKVLSEIPQVEEMEEKEIKCSECDGTGEVIWEYKDKNWETHENEYECPICGGTGYINVEKATGRMISDPDTVVKVGRNGIASTLLQVLLGAMKIVGVTEAHLVYQGNITNHFRIDKNISVILASNIGTPKCELELQKGGER